MENREKILVAFERYHAVKVKCQTLPYIHASGLEAMNEMDRYWKDYMGLSSNMTRLQLIKHILIAQSDALKWERSNPLLAYMRERDSKILARMLSESQAIQ